LSATRRFFIDNRNLTGSAVRPQYRTFATITQRFRSRITGISSAGHLEGNENPEQALVREVREVGVELERWEFFRIDHCTQGDVYLNIKHIYWAQIDRSSVELPLNGGQRRMSVGRDEVDLIQFANILGQLLGDFTKHGALARNAA
jgi:hypothetical protein